jgi:uroporphyrinogen-III synthase
MRHNFQAIFCSLIQYKDLEFDQNILCNYSNIIITSKYLSTMVANFTNCNQNIWVVGEVSASILKQHGLIVRYVAKNVEDLISNLPKSAYCDSVYLSGDHITRMLPEAIKRYIMYRISYRDEFSSVLKDRINNGIDYLLLYSINCAKTIINLFSKYNLIETLKNIVVVTISVMVANLIKHYCKKIIYCNNGQYNQMLELLILDATITY